MEQILRLGSCPEVYHEFGNYGMEIWRLAQDYIHKMLPQCGVHHPFAVAKPKDESKRYHIEEVTERNTEIKPHDAGNQWFITLYHNDISHNYKIVETYDATLPITFEYLLNVRDDMISVSDSILAKVKDAMKTANKITGVANEHHPRVPAWIKPEWQHKIAKYIHQINELFDNVMPKEEVMIFEYYLAKSIGLSKYWMEIRDNKYIFHTSLQYTDGIKIEFPSNMKYPLYIHDTHTDQYKLMVDVVDVDESNRIRREATRMMTENIMKLSSMKYCIVYTSPFSNDGLDYVTNEVAKTMNEVRNIFKYMDISKYVY